MSQSPALLDNSSSSPDTESSRLASALLQFRSGSDKTPFARDKDSPFAAAIQSTGRDALVHASPEASRNTLESPNHPPPLSVPSGMGGGSMGCLLGTTPSPSTLMQLHPTPVGNGNGTPQGAYHPSVVNVLQGQPNMAQHYSIDSPLIQPKTPVTTETVHAQTGSIGSSTGSTTSGTIRTDQVEAALKSKPQRGKKRQGLSELERAALTRSRNREHARTTRIRKKARHQQLVEAEGLLHQFQERSAREQQRREAVMQYIKAREQMIRDRHQTLHESSSTLSSALFRDCVEDMTQFSLEYGCSGEDNDNDSSTTPMDRMISFDKELAFRMERSLGLATLSTLEYSVVNGTDGVSLDGCNGGTVPVDATIRADDSSTTRLTLLQGYLRFKFAKEKSTKLSSVSWWTMRDHFERQDHLNQQISHPSTVSLDPANPPEPSTVMRQSKDLETSSSETHSEGPSGPGMSI